MKSFCAEKDKIRRAMQRVLKFKDKQKSTRSVITFSFLSGAIYLVKLNFSGLQVKSFRLCNVPIWITISLHGNCYNNFKFYY